MLDHLKQHVAGILASTKTIILFTTGPAGMQAHQYPCEAQGILLYMLVPATADHLLNLEQDPFLVASTARWQLRGTAQLLQRHDGPQDLLLPKLPKANDCVLVQIWPTQLLIYRRDGWGFSATIDIDHHP